MNDQMVTVRFRIIKPREWKGDDEGWTGADWQATVDGVIVAEWFGDGKFHPGFLFGYPMDGVYKQREWRRKVAAEFQRRVRSSYRFADDVEEIWTSKPSPYGMEEWHGIRVGRTEYSHMVGLVTGKTFDERFDQTQVLREMHRRICADYTTHGAS